MTFLEWMLNNNACSESVEWVSAQPDQSLASLWQSCQRGDWMLWAHRRTDTGGRYAEIAFRAADRARLHASAALDAAGARHKLHDVVVTDRDSASAAAYAAAYELKKSANDCRELLECPVIEG